MDTTLFKIFILIQELSGSICALVPRFSSLQELEGDRNNWVLLKKPEKAVGF